MRTSSCLLALSFLATSCATSPTRHEPDLVGKSAEEIQHSWGEPIRRETLTDGERWTYRMQRMTHEKTRSQESTTEYEPWSREPKTVEQSFSFNVETVPIEYIGHLIFSKEGTVLSATPGTPLR